MSTVDSRPKITLNTLQRMKERGEKFASIAVYDATFAEFASTAGIEVLLVGDSLGMVVQGHDSTLPVTMEDILYHLHAVRRGNRGALLMGDMPFMSYYSEGLTLENAGRLMRAGAHIVKLEGGSWIAESTRLLVERGIPVCAHMGLTPQSINRFGGFRVQGRDPKQAQKILDEARMLEDSGASILLLEAIPAMLAHRITGALQIPVIGIGAGPHTDGQIMVMHDMLGITPPDIKVPKFVKNFLAPSATGIRGAFEAYARAVKSGEFPGPEHSYD
ncbi:MAG: 3-methyl-2-oxobutanoate hydroxymethyltransferase [Gammaproteobacteria bacterium]